MSKVEWKPGTFVYPIPAVMVTSGDMENSNIITVAWAGTICSDPVCYQFQSEKKDIHTR